MKGLKLRIFKLFVLIGFPAFGLLYAYQFTGQDREVIVPFKTFKAPEYSVNSPGSTSSDARIPLSEAVTVLNFWATWCPPCVEEFPAMMELRRQLKGKGVNLVFVSVDEDWNNVLKFLKTNNVALDSANMFWDPSKATAKKWGSEKFPETYVVRRDGWVVEKIIGQQAWTRPGVIQYFVELGDKFKGVTAFNKWLSTIGLTRLVQNVAGQFITKAYAEDTKKPKANTEKDSGYSSNDPLIHEQDKKTIDKLKQNIETATQNLQNAEAAEKEENRNLQEQKIIFERRTKELNESQSDLEKIEAKTKEVNLLLSKTSDSLKLEEREKRKVESQIKDIQAKIVELQKKLESAKDDLNQANKGLNTRVQSIETFEKAKESSEEESNQLKTKHDKAKGVVAERKKEVDKASKEISDRERKLSEIRSQLAKAKRVLDEQKQKLSEFEQMLKK